MRVQAALKLGRVSNLPTVVTNALAGFVLASGGMPGAVILPVMLAAALAYTGGMFLNDAFDAEFDRVHQPFRPIPAGQADRSQVMAWGMAMLAASVVGFALAGGMQGASWPPAAVGAALAGTILIYDWHHKGNPFGPVLMGLCRLLIYVAAGLAANGTLGGPFWIGAGLLMAHVMGLSFIAKAEHSRAAARWLPRAALIAAPLTGAGMALAYSAMWPFVLALGLASAVALHLATRPAPNYGRIVPLLIAAISLLDAMMIARMGLFGPALAAACAVALTLWLQRWVRGT